jgi:hypothetical protein
MKTFVKPVIAVLVFATICLLMPVFASADDVEVSISPSEITINTSEIGTVDVVVVNNQDVEDTFQVSVWPSTTWAGITPDLEKDKVKISSGSNSTIKLYFSVESSAEEIISTFLVSAKSTNTDETISSSINVKTRKKSLVYISDFALDKSTLNPGDCISIIPSITNDGFITGTYRLQTSVKKGTTILKRFDDDVFEIEGKSIKTLPKTYCFDNYTQPGTYSVDIVLRTDINKFLDSRTTSIKVNEVSNLVFKKSGIYTPFVQMKSITVKNDGNIVEENFNITESVSEFTSRFFYPVDKPTDVKRIGGNTIYIWNVESLAPGEQIEIKYEIRFIILWVSGIGLALLVFFAFSYVYRPRIKKTVRFIGPLKKGKETVVLLEIKNSTINEIKNVVVQDSVSAIATLIEKFDTIAPTVRKSSSGTSLTWKIKSLKPLEERVLTYRIKPKVDIIGSMRLPRATMQFVNKKKETKTVASKSIEIK